MSKSKSKQGQALATVRNIVMQLKMTLQKHDEIYHKTLIGTLEFWGQLI